MYKYTRKQAIEVYDSNPFGDKSMRQLFLEKKQWKPNPLQFYYAVNLNREDFYMGRQWRDELDDRINFKRGLVCQTKQQAIKLAKKMLKAI